MNLEPTTTADERGELFGVHIPELQLPDDEYRAAMRAAALAADELYIELGSGHGNGLVIAAAEFGARAFGVEYLEDANERAVAAALRAGVGDRVNVRREDLRTTDPTPADVLYLHLGPAFHDLLAPRLERMLTRSTRVIAAGWRVPGWLPVPGTQDSWDAGYVYRPADPLLHATWGPALDSDTGRIVREFHAHADLEAIEARVDGVVDDQGSIELSAHVAGRGQSILAAWDPTTIAGEVTLWARCRAGRFSSRGAGAPSAPDPRTYQPNLPAT